MNDFVYQIFMITIFHWIHVKVLFKNFILALVSVALLVECHSKYLEVAGSILRQGTHGMGPWSGCESEYLQRQSIDVSLSLPSSFLFFPSSLSKNVF